MFYAIYNILSLFLVLPVFLFNIYRSFKRGWPLAIPERFGFVAKHLLAPVADRPVIWLHAVSVGEIIAARPLLLALRSSYPLHALVVTCTTETGKTTAERFPEIDLCLYFPFDFLPSVKAIFSAVKPRIIIIMETEIWPNFCREAARRNIPLLLANGRISDRSFKRYLSFGWFFRPALRCFSAICMQSATGCNRITAIGAAGSIVHEAGNLKHDIASRPTNDTDRTELRIRYAIPASSCVWTVGSCREGEEPFLIATYRKLREEFDNLLLVLVPRHTERCGIIGGLLEQAELPFRLRTSLKENDTPLRTGEVLLVDTVGEMMDLYRLADFSFVGGSLVPIGGHNLLEPASVGVPSVFGPYMANFREIETLVREYGAGVQIQSPDELTTTCQTLITSTELRRVLGQNGLKLLRDNGGAAARHLEIIARYL